MRFNFDKRGYSKHQLYHVKYGRGAVIVAIPMDNKVALECARKFNNRSEGDAYTVPTFNFVKSIEEDGDLVLVDFHSQDIKNEGPIVTRVLPFSQVTFEIY